MRLSSLPLQALPPLTLTVTFVQTSSKSELPNYSIVQAKMKENPDVRAEAKQRGSRRV